MNCRKCGEKIYWSGYVTPGGIYDMMEAYCGWCGTRYVRRVKETVHLDDEVKK